MPEDKEMVLREKRKDATKEIVRGGVKFCVGAFFGAVAAYITGDSNMPKLMRGTIIGGGSLLGLTIGDQVANNACLSIDKFSQHWNQFQDAKKREEESK